MAPSDWTPPWCPEALPVGSIVVVAGPEESGERFVLAINLLWLMHERHTECTVWTALQDRWDDRGCSVRDPIGLGEGDDAWGSLLRDGPDRLVILEDVLFDNVPADLGARAPRCGATFIFLNRCERRFPESYEGRFMAAPTDDACCVLPTQDFWDFCHAHGHGAYGDIGWQPALGARMGDDCFHLNDALQALHRRYSLVRDGAGEWMSLRTHSLIGKPVWDRWVGRGDARSEWSRQTWRTAGLPVGATPIAEDVVRRMAVQHRLVCRVARTCRQWRRAVDSVARVTTESRFSARLPGRVWRPVGVEWDGAIHPVECPYGSSGTAKTIEVLRGKRLSPEERIGYFEAIY